MAHHMRHPSEQPGQVVQVRLNAAGFPYACDSDGSPVRAAVLEEGHPDDDLPFGDDLSPEEEDHLED